MEKKLKEMRSDAKVITPSIIVGKNGLTEPVIQKIKDELTRNKLVKIKILPSLMTEGDKKKLFNEIEEKSGAKTVLKIGFTITLSKRL